MKTLYLECSMGAAGDMLMAALWEIIPEKEAFLDKINGLGLPGLRVQAEASMKCGITGTHMAVTVSGQEEESLDANPAEPEAGHSGHSHYFPHSHDGHHSISDHTHNHSEPEHNHPHQPVHSHDDYETPSFHHHHHQHTQMKDIETILSNLPVSKWVKEHALSIYRLIAEAEAHAHGIPVTEVHFHEVGNLDAITDIVGVCLLLEELAPDQIIASPVHTGGGFVRCSHGVLPVPAPATAHILLGVPSYGGKIKGELCTPTGAAILKHFADSFGPMPEMAVQKIGYGMGKKEFEAANCLRVFYGEKPSLMSISGSPYIHRSAESNAQAENNGQADKTSSFQGETPVLQNKPVLSDPNGEIALLQCNIDDMTAEAVSFAAKTLMAAGAKDVYTTVIGMKKDRPGVILNCLCDVAQADFFATLILRHTTTFGVRQTIFNRYLLAREIRTVSTRYGEVRLKTGSGYGVTKTKLEYEDVAALAKEHQCSIMEMERRIWADLNRGEEKG